MDELSQLDELIESDIMDALGENTTESNTPDTNNNEPIPSEESQEEPLIETLEEDSIVVDDLKSNSTENIRIDNISEVNTNDLVSLLGQLLNNKTIEITIKIKD